MKKGVSKNLVCLGFLGFIGFRGLNHNPLYFLYFAFGGYFSYFWWSKLGQIKDECLMANKRKAASISFGVCFAIAFVLSFMVKLSSFDLQSSYKMQLLIVSFAFAISINLWAYLTYKFN
ncbi:DUF3796 domain-containing protein [Clostridiaceae bacterium M8S5]|nr:DUF3796 domain-containing protein [Clostridiaceae bacterium M8S5]